MKVDIMKEVTEYEIEKAKHKRLLVRNEFRGVGKYNIPVVRKQSIDLIRSGLRILRSQRQMMMKMQKKLCIFSFTIGNLTRFTTNLMKKSDFYDFMYEKFRLFIDRRRELGL